MLLSLLYHRAYPCRYGNDLKTIESHFEYISSSYKVVLPGERLDSNRINVCLTFDDATADFYLKVFPLLIKYNLSGLLAVPAGLVADVSKECLETRLKLLEKVYDIDKGHSDIFCTWKEIREMVKSSKVQIASHGLTHSKNLSQNDYELEIINSKTLIKEKAGITPLTFVYPFGRVNKQFHNLVLKHYEFGMRIGSASNSSWHDVSKMHYRINADNCPDVTELFSKKRLTLYSLKRVKNCLIPPIFWRS